MQQTALWQPPAYGDGWISTGDRLPDDEVDVLTWSDDAMTVCYLRDGVWFIAGGMFANPPAFWRDLPEPPEATP